MNTYDQLESSELSLYAARRDNPAGAAAVTGFGAPFVVAVEAAVVASEELAEVTAAVTSLVVWIVEAAAAGALGLTSTNGVFRFTKGCEVPTVLLGAVAMLGLVSFVGGGFISSSFTSSIISSLIMRLLPSALFLKLTDLQGIVGLLTEYILVGIELTLQTPRLRVPHVPSVHVLFRPYCIAPALLSSPRFAVACLDHAAPQDFRSSRSHCGTVACGSQAISWDY